MSKGIFRCMGSGQGAVFSKKELFLCPAATVGKWCPSPTRLPQ